MRRGAWVVGVVLVAGLLVPASLLAQSFATSIAVVQLKVWLFDKPGKVAKLGKAEFLLPSGEIERQGSERAAGLVFPAYAFVAINTNDPALIKNAIKSCSLQVKNSSSKTVACEKFSDVIEGEPVEFFFAFFATPIVANGDTTATVTRKGGKKSPAGTTVLDAMVWANGALLARSSEPAGRAAANLALERVREQARRLIREQRTVR